MSYKLITVKCTSFTFLTTDYSCPRYCGYYQNLHPKCKCNPSYTEQRFCDAHTLGHMDLRNIMPHMRLTNCVPSFHSLVKHTITVCSGFGNKRQCAVKVTCRCIAFLGMSSIVRVKKSNRQLLCFFPAKHENYQVEVSHHRQQYMTEFFTTEIQRLIGVGTVTARAIGCAHSEDFHTSCYVSFV